MAQLILTAASSTNVGEEEWVTIEENKIDLAWISRIFPSKACDKLNVWLNVLQENEFESIDDLRMMGSADWDKLPLPLSVKVTIQKHIVPCQQPDEDECKIQKEDSTLTEEDQLGTVEAEPEFLTEQIDIVVMDISGSMKSRSSLDNIDTGIGTGNVKTREDMSKVLFHTMMDKLISFELFHAVGLLAFGHGMTPISVTKEVESFHDELGRLDANERRTKLYDAIWKGVDMIEEYIATHHSEINHEKLQKRIFVLTDGMDNASDFKPWQVSQKLQQAGIRLDSIPLGGANRTLQALTLSSGGLYFDVDSQEQGMSLFENEATLSLAFREQATGPSPPAVTDADVFTTFAAGLNVRQAVTREIRAAVPKSAFAKVATAAEAKAAIQEGRVAGGSLSRRSLKRVTKEFLDIQKNPAPGTTVHMGAEDAAVWKAVLTDLPGAYAGGTWVLTVEFPADYPFKPPRVRFATPIYHCNVSSGGGICLDVLKDGWHPALTVARVLASVRALVEDPNAEDPMDAFKGQQCRDDRAAYDAAVREHTQRHAALTPAELQEKYGVELP